MSLTEKAKFQTTKNDCKVRILHVDDDPQNLEISKAMLMDLNSNFEIDGAGSVGEAFKKLAAGHYDVVISDYQIPQKDGLRFLKEIRDQKNEIPFIMFTGKGREEIAIEALNLGATRYFNKQGDPATVYGELSYGIIQSVQHARLSFGLRQKSAIIESVIENVGAGLKIIGKDYRIIWANKYLKGLGGEEGKFCYSVFNNLNTVCPDCGVKKIFEGGQALNSRECTGVDSNGEVFWIEFIVSPIRDERGNVVAALELALSTTERKKNEAQLMSANCRIHVLEELKAETNA